MTLIPRHPNDPRWFFFALLVPELVLAIVFAPKVEGAVRAPVTAAMNAALCRAFPGANPCHQKVKRHGE